MDNNRHSTIAKRAARRRATAALAVCACILLGVPALAQTTRYVNAAGGDNNANICTDPANPCRTIYYAVNVALSGDIVKIAGGVYTERIFISKSLALQGAGDDAVVVQADTKFGDATGRVIAVDPFMPNPSIDVAISGITIRHGVASGQGDAGTGGGLFVTGATLALTDVTFMANSAAMGGGMRTSAESSVTLNRVRFIGNRATDGCGGLYAENGPATLTDVTFSQNTAGQLVLNGRESVSGDAANPRGPGFQSGGGMCATVSATPLGLTHVAFNRNAAGGDGGGMVLDGAATLTDVTFWENIAHGDGGGLYSTGFHTLAGLEFTGNHAGNRGGGMWHFGAGYLQLTGATFQGNSADEGGGLHFQSVTSAATLDDVKFLGNHANAFGGGMANISGSPAVTHATFTGNEAGEGGGFYNYDASPLFTHVSFHDNHASGDGGGMLNEASSPTLVNARFQHNSAGNNGGGLYNNTSSPTLVNVSIGANHANFGGGGMENTQSSNPFFANVTLSGNTAALGGGIGNNFNSSILAYDTVVWGNSANGSGDEIYNTADSSSSMYFSLIRTGAGHIIEGGDFLCNNCIDQDPLFVDPGNGNLRLQTGSAAIDAGDPDAGPQLFPVDANGNPVDLDDNPRFFGNAIDMGAYEWQPLGEAIFSDRFEVEINAVGPL